MRLRPGRADGFSGGREFGIGRQARPVDVRLRHEWRHQQRGGTSTEYRHDKDSGATAWPSNLGRRRRPDIDPDQACRRAERSRQQPDRALSASIPARRRSRRAFDRPRADGAQAGRPHPPDRTRHGHLGQSHRQKRQCRLSAAWSFLAERQGFEPWMGVLHPYSLSRGAPSASRASLRDRQESVSGATDSPSEPSSLRILW